MGKRLWVLAAVAVGTIGLAAIASAEDTSANARAGAVATLDALKQDPAHVAVTGDAVVHARDALERGTRMRVSGDEMHALLADGLALDWALTARDLERAVDVEERARNARLLVLDAGAVVERERALLEEGIARTGRLRAELETTRKDKRESPSRTSPLGASSGQGTRRVPAAPGPAGAHTQAAADGGLP